MNNNNNNNNNKCMIIVSTMFMHHVYAGIKITQTLQKRTTTPTKQTYTCTQIH